MRLVFVAHSFPPSYQDVSQVGGMQRVAYDLLEALQRNTDVTVIPLVLRPPRFVPLLISIIFFYFWSFLVLFRMCQRKEIDAILFSSMVTACMAPVLSFFFKNKVPVMGAIAHGHDVLFSFSPYASLIRHAIRSLDTLAPVSHNTAKALLNRGALKTQCVVIPNGVSLTRFAPPPSFDQRRAVLRRVFSDQNLPDNAFLMLTVGRQIKRKGHAWFVEHVMPYLPPETHLWLAGEGPESVVLERLIRQLHLEGRVCLLGALDEEKIQALYHGADLFIMPNIQVAGDCEGFGVVILEAGINQMPVVAARLEGIVDAVSEGINGLLVPPSVSKAYQDVIQALSQNPKERESMGLRAASYVKRTFVWSEIAAEHIILLKKGGALKNAALHNKKD